MLAAITTGSGRSIKTTEVVLAPLAKTVRHTSVRMSRSQSVDGIIQRLHCSTGLSRKTSRFPPLCISIPFVAILL